MMIGHRMGSFIGDCLREQIQAGYALEGRDQYEHNAFPGRALTMMFPTVAYPAECNGIDPLLCKGMPGSLDAADECEHGRLPSDPTPDCGCWPTLEEPEPQPRPWEWSAERAIAALVDVAREEGYLPSRQEWLDGDYTPSIRTIVRVCGSWGEAVERAGFPRPLPGRRRRLDEYAWREAA